MLLRFSDHLAALPGSLLAKPEDSAISHTSAAGGEVDQYRYARPTPSQGYLSRDAQA